MVTLTHGCVFAALSCAAMFGVAIGANATPEGAKLSQAGANAKDGRASALPGVQSAPMTTADADSLKLDRPVVSPGLVQSELDEIDRLLASSAWLSRSHSKHESPVPARSLPEQAFIRHAAADAHFIAAELQAYERVRDERQKLRQLAAEHVRALRVPSALEKKAAPPLSLPQPGLTIGERAHAGAPERSRLRIASEVGQQRAIFSRAPIRRSSLHRIYGDCARRNQARSALDLEYHALRQGYAGGAPNLNSISLLPPRFFYYTSQLLTAASRPHFFFATVFNQPARRTPARRPSHEGAPSSGDFT
ncbi:MAG: hypothetical protein NXI24_24855 [bacterium]|nr:hypothetical protein [bacterium]